MRAAEEGKAEERKGGTETGREGRLDGNKKRRNEERATIRERKEERPWT